MWIFTLDGFFSAVQKPEDVPGDKISVRVRAREDLVRLMERLKIRSKIIATPQADYPYRIVIGRDVWTRYVELMAQELTYPNFKQENKKIHGPGAVRIHAMYEVWQTMQAIEAVPWPRRRGA